MANKKETTTAKLGFLGPDDSVSLSSGVPLLALNKIANVQKVAKQFDSKKEPASKIEAALPVVNKLIRVKPSA